MDDGGAIWYAIASNARGLMALESQLNAFLGLSLSSYSGGPTTLDSEDVWDQLVEKDFDYVVKVEVSAGPNTDQATGRLRLLRELLRTQPERSVEALRPGADILRDLEESIRLRDHPLSEQLLEEAKLSGQFDSKNLIFLEFLVLELTSEWSGLLNHPKLERVIAQPRPSRVTQALLRAIYWTELESLEGDVVRATKYFREVIEPQYRGLFATKIGTSGRETEVLFFLKAVALDPQDPDLAEELLREVRPEEEHHSWLVELKGELGASLSQLVETIGAEGALEQGRALVGKFQIDRAWERALEAGGGLEQIELLGRCALISNSIERIRTVLEMANEISGAGEDPIVGRVLAELGARIDSDPLSEDGPLPPEGWGSWASRFSEPTPFSEGVTLADLGAEEWDLLELVKDQADSEMFAGALESASEENARFIRASVPYLLRALDQAPGSALGLKRIYQALWLIVLTDDEPGRSYFNTLADLAEKLIESGVTPAEYKDLLSEINDRVTKDGSPKSMIQLMDLVDLLLEGRCPDPGARENVVATVLSKARNLREPELMLLRDLVTECGLEFPEEFTRQLNDLQSKLEEGPVSPLRHLANKYVALYSLEKKSLRRLCRVLEESVDDIKVREFSDHGGTSALREAARTADVFLVVTRAATHAATDFITQNRPPERDKPIYPSGKGSSSMLDALINIEAE